MQPTNNQDRKKLNKTRKELSVVRKKLEALQKAVINSTDTHLYKALMESMK